MTGRPCSAWTSSHRSSAVGDVGVHEVLLAVRADMRLVQGGRVQDRVRAGHALAHQGPIRDRPDHRREGRSPDVDAGDVVPVGTQYPDKGLAKMARASRHQDPRGSHGG